MRSRTKGRPLSGAIVVVLITLAMAVDTPAQGAMASSPEAGAAAAPQLQTSAQLQQLVSPIALYPDPLVAQILAASQYPTEIVEAHRWVKENAKLTSSQLQAAAAKQPWDPSVMALTQFPPVLANMNANLSWTSALGDAYYHQPQDVMKAIQTLRTRAYQAGNLKTTPQQTVTVKSGQAGQTTVTSQGNQTIVIEPSNPQVVYVPAYNPTTVYGGQTEVYPGYSSTDLLATSLLSFGVGMAVGAAFSGGWGCNWGGGNVVYNNNVYIAHNSVWGPNRWNPYNPYHPYHPYNPYNPYHPYHPYNPAYHPYNPAYHPYNPAYHPNNPAYHPYENAANHPYGHDTGYHPATSPQSRGNWNNYRGYDNRGASGFENRGAFDGFDRGGNARMASDRGFSSLGGWGHGGGGFHGYGGGGGFHGFHGGGGGFHGRR